MMQNVERYVSKRTFLPCSPCKFGRLYSRQMDNTLEEKLLSLGLNEPFDSFSAPLIEKLLIKLSEKKTNSTEDIEQTNLSDVTCADIANEVDDKIHNLYQQLSSLKRENHKLHEQVFFF